MKYENQLVDRNYPFTEENIFTVLDLTDFHYGYLRADLALHMETPFDEWMTIYYDGDTHPRYHTVSVSEHIKDFLSSLFIPEMNRDRIGWFCIPPETMGAFHYDTLSDRHTAINLDMKFDTGAGLFFLENPPHQPGKVIRVEYPEDKFVMLNIQEGHMIINESPTPRMILTISFRQYYHELVELINKGEFYREQ